ncbi:hypothetical protein C826_00315 [Helicobacter bilis WiWa]|uniref:Uncharacterized protein n=1 Tax=Helicobacter bilis WiWa TaxID=1235804 RepID=N2BRX7_9HELI|nr:hypothetical protein C826_00315 [Helicobacter bilis WiWa]
MDRQTISATTQAFLADDEDLTQGSTLANPI